MRATQLRCEYLGEPLGVDSLRPILGWELEAKGRGQIQTAYQILVASSPRLLVQDKGDLWNSKRVKSSQSVQVPYDGRPLASFQRCHWKVRVWDGAGKASAWSAPSFWEMGVLDKRDWQAQWIANDMVTLPWMVETPVAPLLRKVFTVAQPIQSARVYICGLGYYELSINGRKIGDRVLDPGLTKFDQRVLYATYDVTPDLTAGVNAIGVTLGNGMYNNLPDMDGCFRFDRPKLLLQLRLVLADGTVQTVVSDAAWQSSTGPIVFNAVRNGEVYDARLEKPGWDQPDYDAQGWTPTQLIPAPGGTLVSSMLPPIRVTQTIRPVEVKEVKPGVFVFDMGQAFSGWCQLTVTGPAGTKVQWKCGERLAPDGQIETTRIAVLVKHGEFQTDSYILKGQGTEVWEPRFTYHAFRYVQMTGFPGRPTLDNLRGRVAHTDLPVRGEFACSNPLLNKIHDLVRWSTVSNYHSVPTDCPHREKNGWTGDALVSADQFLYNYDMTAALKKWMRDIHDAQRPSGQLPGIIPTSGWGYNWGSGPAWDSAYIHFPWLLYQYAGDTSVLAEQYEGMQRYMEFAASMATAHILSFGLGDWCPPRGAEAYRTPVAVTSTAYYFSDARIMAETAALLGKKSDAKKYRRLAGDIKTAFRAKFYNPDTGTITGGEQTGLACALYFGLIEPAEAGRVFAALVAEIEGTKRHLDCGILGAKYIMNVLTDYDRNDLAYAIATQTDFPSWGHWIAQGATTLWENWNGADSRLHHMFSDVGAWFYKALAGLRPDPANPGFQSFILKPQPVSDLTWVKASHLSPHGLIRSEWQIHDGRFIWDITVPVNTTATVYVPTTNAAGITEGGKPMAKSASLKFQKAEGGRAVLTAGSGAYRLNAPY
jgi:alpha-L-rhamnosidase